MLVTFDFDGTLVDSMPALRRAAVGLISEAFEKSYQLADTWYMSTIGRSFEEQLNFLFRGDSMNTTVARYFALKQDEIYADVALHFGVIDTISYLNERGIKYSVCSSTSSKHIKSVFERLLPEWNGVITGLESGTKRTQLEFLAPSWFVGDTVYDCVISSKVGTKFIGVTHTSDLQDVKRLGRPIADSIPSALDTLLGVTTEDERSSQELSGRSSE